MSFLPLSWLSPAETVQTKGLNIKVIGRPKWKQESMLAPQAGDCGRNLGAKNQTEIHFSASMFLPVIGPWPRVSGAIFVVVVLAVSAYGPNL